MTETLVTGLNHLNTQMWNQFLCSLLIYSFGVYQSKSEQLMNIVWTSLMTLVLLDVPDVSLQDDLQLCKGALRPWRWLCLAHYKVRAANSPLLLQPEIFFKLLCFIWLKNMLDWRKSSTMWKKYEAIEQLCWTKKQDSYIVKSQQRRTMPFCRTS